MEQRSDTVPEPALVIMAAGMGSRYGGLKQIDPVDAQKHIIIDFSMYDALRTGFKKIIFIIKKEDEEDFKNIVGNRMEKIADVAYAYQDINNIPDMFKLPPKRKKPWGTAHAILSAAEMIHGPFAVINADDYYGLQAFQEIYDYLTTHSDDDKYRYAMVGYPLKNTVTKNGHVARGICCLNRSDELTEITERTHIEMRSSDIAYTEDEGKTWVSLPDNTLVSMNMWGFTESILYEIQNSFCEFLQTGLEKDPLKCEYYLPSVVNRLLKEKKAAVKVLPTNDRWYGVTYKEDKAAVMQAIQMLKDTGVYPENLWED